MIKVVLYLQEQNWPSGTKEQLCILCVLKACQADLLAATFTPSMNAITHQHRQILCTDAKAATKKSEEKSRPSCLLILRLAHALMRKIRRLCIKGLGFVRYFQQCRALNMVVVDEPTANEELPDYEEADQAFAQYLDFE